MKSPAWTSHLLAHFRGYGQICLPRCVCARLWLRPQYSAKRAATDSTYSYTALQYLQRGNVLMSRGTATGSKEPELALHLRQHIGDVLDRSSHDDSNPRAEAAAGLKSSEWYF